MSNFELKIPGNLFHTTKDLLSNTWDLHMAQLSYKDGEPLITFCIDKKKNEKEKEIEIEIQK